MLYQTSIVFTRNAYTLIYIVNEHYIFIIRNKYKAGVTLK